MYEFVMTNESAVRLTAFFGILVGMALLEARFPRRERTVSRLVRWPSNIGIVFLNTIILRIIFPTAAVGVALFVEEKQWGILQIVDLPLWLTIVVAVVALDLIIYLQHVMVHAVPALWRLHRMHHSDVDIDVTTGARFHPVEIVLSMVIKFASVVALGAPAIAVIVFEVILNGTSMFNHSNVKLPRALDRVLRLFLVTPDMHRVHHSINPEEANCNFGFNLPWWDRLMETYRDQPRDGHEGMTIGLDRFRDPRDQWLDRLVIQPVLGEPGDYVINRRSFDRKDEE